MPLPAELAKYPGLFPAEVPILRAWLALHQSEYDSIDFNVRVGTGADPGPGYDDATRAMAVANTQYRIDAVAVKGSIVILIEVKQHAGAGALGQVIAYEHLWNEAHPTRPATKLLIVAQSAQPDLDRIAEAEGITLELVQPAAG